MPFDDDVLPLTAQLISIKSTNPIIYKTHAGYPARPSHTPEKAIALIEIIITDTEKKYPGIKGDYHIITQKNTPKK
jgi:hypothetical protein